MKKKVAKKTSTKKIIKKVEKVEAKKEKENESPSWYHYVIVLGVFFLIGFVVYIGFEIYDKYSNPDIKDVFEDNSKLIYEYQREGVTYNLELDNSVETLERLNFSIQTQKIDILNTIDIIFSFDTYNGTDNGYVTRSSVKLKRFLDVVYFFQFDQGDFTTLDNLTCINSTKNNRIVTFTINSTRSGVFEDENGCLSFESTTPQELPAVVDTFMIHIVEDK